MSLSDSSLVLSWLLSVLVGYRLEFGVFGSGVTGPSCFYCRCETVTEEGGGQTAGGVPTGDARERTLTRATLCCIYAGVWVFRFSSYLGSAASFCGVSFTFFFSTEVGVERAGID